MIREPTGKIVAAAQIATTSSTPSTLAPFLLHLFNMILGLIGLAVMGYGAVLVLYVLWRQYRGETIADYHGQWNRSASPALPSVAGAVVMVAIGSVIVGIVLSGLWMDLVNSMIAIGKHIDAQIAHHVKGG